MDWVGNTEKLDWHKWRGMGLGSSDAPVLLGVNPWKSLHTLWLEKTDQLPEEKKFKGNWATERGNRLEPIVRDTYNKRFGTNMQPENMEYKLKPFMRVSFDGIDHDLRRVIEIKCPGAKDHQTAMAGEVPEKYMPQVQWQLMISGYDDLDYISWDGESDELAIVRVKPDQDMIKKLYGRAVWFWNLVQTKTPPPSNTTEQQLTEQEQDALSRHLKEYASVKRQIDNLMIQSELLKQYIKAIVKSDKTVCGEFTVSWVEKKGAIDYNKIEALKGIDLEKYRGDSTKYIMIKESKK